jgi:hypothetical protein
VDHVLRRVAADRGDRDVNLVPLAGEGAVRKLGQRGLTKRAGFDMRLDGGEIVTRQISGQ